ncbi:uncharacterized protein BO97DRAFT_419952 [Aspergillus homomorphus CBS 101889]|uniref:INO80 complex subunit F domain-containing protein n=1 Tax=Aspergillus homomorphus (strain CBS 101889) TaxID=1450537 RepID=A0A395IBZ0_ASPHC|nr:hypothetical protein BO97DRAFT_419952 [Aspergillus homomorphus CBS 101889]RAL17722.1 hypothetical protein BO97DRAFT_419952 [Aspergillus homomorphus CBS 101889]
MEDPTATSTARPSTTTTTTTANPPSVENAYKRKCLALKKRLNEIEDENELMRVRNRRGWQYIQKMRLESCILLERLAKVTGMTEEASSQAGAAAANPELRARAAALMGNASALNGLSAAAAAEGKVGGAGAASASYMDDETEGSSDEQPPTPQERPLRVKRSRKSNLPDGTAGADDDEGTTTAAATAASGAGGAAGGTDPAENNNNSTSNSTSSTSALPRLAPAPSQDDLTTSFRLHGQHPESDERGTSQNPDSGSRDTRAANDEDDDEDDDDDEAAADDAEDVENEGGDASVEPESTPMDLDAKEPKEEN